MKSLTASRLYLCMLSSYIERLQSSSRTDNNVQELMTSETKFSNHERIPLLEVEAIVTQVADATGDWTLGLDIGENIHPSDYGIVGYSQMNCTTLMQTAELAGRFGHLMNEAFKVKLEKHSSFLHYQIEDASKSDASAVLIELHFSSAIEMARFLTGPQHAQVVSFSEVSFKHSAHGNVSMYERIFGCPVKFKQKKNEFIVSKNVLNLPIRSSNSKMFKMLIQKVNRLSDSLYGDASLEFKVRNYIATQILTKGVPCATKTAENFNMSLSTLKKHLKHENTNFTVICDEVKKLMALEMIINQKKHLKLISNTLGFSSINCFHRAFKRWTKLTPTEYIHKHKK